MWSASGSNRFTTYKEPPVPTEHEAGHVHAAHPTTIPLSPQPLTRSLSLYLGYYKGGGGGNCKNMAGYLQGQMVALQSGRWTTRAECGVCSCALPTCLPLHLHNTRKRNTTATAISGTIPTVGTLATNVWKTGLKCDHVKTQFHLNYTTQSCSSYVRENDVCKH
jgi:hypothetical protein